MVIGSKRRLLEDRQNPLDVNKKTKIKMKRRINQKKISTFITSKIKGFFLIQLFYI